MGGIYFSWYDTDPIAVIEDLAADTLLDFIGRLASSEGEEEYFTREIEMNLVWREADAQVNFALRGNEPKEVAQRFKEARDHVYNAHYLVGARQGVEAAKEIQAVVRTLYGAEPESAPRRE